MGQKELFRGKILEMVKQGNMPLKTAAATLQVSYRQAIRLYAVYRKEGDAGLVHGNCGKKSNNRLAKEIREAAIKAYKELYSGFGPVLAAEKLAEERGLQISISSLRNLLIESGEWKGRQKGNVYRSRRECRACFGELVKFDVRHHMWFENRNTSCCLITMTDDATNTSFSRFFKEETIAGAMEVFSCWIRSYGIPEALYCDRKNVFMFVQEPIDTELPAGITEPKSHFERACEKLGVMVITANNPQAKSRIGRNYGLDQNQLVKELSLKGIFTIEKANQFLEKTYLPKLNRMFSHPAAKQEDAHVPLGSANLKDIMCLEYERTVGDDYVVCYDKWLFQILKSNKPLPCPGDKVIIRIAFNGMTSIIWNKAKLLFREITNYKTDKSQCDIST